jgi:hypothetical protein
LSAGFPLGRAVALGAKATVLVKAVRRTCLVAAAWAFLDDSVVSDEHRCELGVLLGNAFPNEFRIRTAISIMGLPHRGLGASL